MFSRIRELESRLAKISQADRAEDTKQKELIHGLKVDNVDLNLKISELERDLVIGEIISVALIGCFANTKWAGCI